MTNDTTIDRLLADDEACFNKAVSQEDDECLRCDGYDATCHYYISNRTMDLYDKSAVDSVREAVADGANKIRQAYKTWKERKNRFD